MSCKRITGKDYENARTDCLVNFADDVLGPIYNSSIRDKESFEVVCRLHQNNIKQFKAWWGKQSCCWVGFERHWIWVHEFEHCDIYVLSAPEKGTGYEAVVKGDLNKAKAEIRDFMNDLAEQLTE